MSNLTAFRKRLAPCNGQHIYWRQKDVARIAAHFRVDPSLAPITAAVSSKRSMSLKATASKGMVAHFIASDGSIDRMGDVIDPNGWDLSAYKRNSVVLWAHDGTSVPIGKATSVKVQDGRLLASVQFAPTEMGRGVSDMVSGGFLKAMSVGFRPTEFEFARSASRKNGIDFHKQELLEVSIVPVPANPNCLLTGIFGSDGKSLTAKAARADLLVMKARLDPKTRRLVELAAIKRRARR